MYRASNGQFETIPHVCSYEAVDEHHGVISNILFLPRDGDIARHHWPIFSEEPPERPDLRTLWFSVLGLEGQSLVEATSPRQLSRAWVHFILGASNGALLLYPLTNTLPRRVAVDVLVWVPAEGRQHRECTHDRKPREEKGVWDTQRVPGPSLLIGGRVLRSQDPRAVQASRKTGH